MLNRFVLTITGSSRAVDRGQLALVGAPELGQRRAVAVRVVRPAAMAPLAVALDLALELVGEQVDRRVHVGRALARAQHGALRPDRGLGDLAVGDRGVPLDRQLQLDPRRLVEVLRQLRELALGVVDDRIRHVEILAGDLKLHRAPPSSVGPGIRSVVSRGSVAERPCEREHVDARGASGAQRPGAGVGRRARRVDVVDQRDAQRRARGRARTTPRRLRRRARWSRPRCGGASRLAPQQFAPRAASPSARRARVRAPAARRRRGAVHATGSPARRTGSRRPGGTRRSSITRAATSARSRPPSFQRRTSTAPAPRWATAAQADANAGTNAWHSRQLATSQRVGAPQRAQQGAPTGSSSATQDAHQSVPGAPHPAQRLRQDQREQARRARRGMIAAACPRAAT